VSTPVPADRPFDPGLQPERTALAWRRTALALVIGSLLGLRVLPALLGPVGLLVAAAGVIAALAVLAAAHLRYRRVHRILTAGSAGSAGSTGPGTTALPGGALPALVAGLTACAGVAALVLALAR
jgi:uncharacterized membrane protein YidH (DUF202 family)